MKKTSKGNYNSSKVKKIYEELKNKLNDYELSLLTDNLTWDKHVLIKTALLIKQDFKDLLKK